MITTSITQLKSNQDNYHIKNNSWFEKIQRFLQKQLIATIGVSVLLSLSLTGTSAWNVWRIYQGLQNTITKQFKLQELSGNIIHLDEVLTMSARMAASTGNTNWEGRYNQYAPQLDESIKIILQNISLQDQENVKTTNEANQKLVDYETKAFNLVRQGKSPEALQLLLGNQYNQQKQIYNQGIQETLTKVKSNVSNEIKEYRQDLLVAVYFAIATILLLGVSWSIVLLAVKGYIRDRQIAQGSLSASQENLLKLNQSLEGEVELRKQQEAKIIEENELIQNDVAHILDVVSALEEGDLTIQAEVNERATGLVSDTLNRLIESLEGIIAIVVDAAGSVKNSSSELEQLAVDTATQAKDQTISLERVKSLMDSINILSGTSQEQAKATDQAVNLAKIAVESGKQEMNAMVGGITTLQEGTEQIVKRTQLLNDFVELAAQFSKEQKRLAALTRVLSLNASTLSLRAGKEQDPEQFVSISREFEAIANQVKRLSAETQQGLVVLEQRTEQIQTVTSGLNQDIGDISQLVQKFTNEVNSTRQAFENIQVMTEKVGEVGQQMNYSSQELVNVANQTMSAIEWISSIAQSTANSANITQEEVQNIRNLANTLLQKVEFFKLANHN